MHTRYTFQGNGVEIELSFLHPHFSTTSIFFRDRKPSIPSAMFDAPLFDFGNLMSCHLKSSVTSCLTCSCANVRW
jgi:hypothetical protein